MFFQNHPNVILKQFPCPCASTSLAIRLGYSFKTGVSLQFSGRRIVIPRVTLASNDLAALSTWEYLLGLSSVGW